MGLGTNLGNREANLAAAVVTISTHPQIELLAQSKWHENPAIEDAGPHNFLNGVIKISTSLEPFELLAFTKSVENQIDPAREERGRKKARVLDIDILTYGDLVLNTEELTLPHPRMHKRSFVTKPMRELEALEYTSELLSNIDARESARKQLINQCKQAAKAIIDKQSYSVRRMYLADLEQVIVLNQKIYGDHHWTREAFVHELSNPNAVYYVAESAGKILAFVGVWLIAGEMQIMTLGTDPDHRRRGIAEVLLIAAIDTALENKITSIILDVRASNTPAQNLYYRYGFVHQGLRKAYYEPDGEDALILRLDNLMEQSALDLFLRNLSMIS